MATTTNSASTQNPFASSGGTAVGPVFALSSSIIETTATAFTAKINQSGGTYMLPAVGAVITLPAVASCNGVVWTFIMQANNVTTAWTITPATSVLYGTVTQGTSSGSTQLTKVAGASITLSTTALAGDWLRIQSDGTHFYVSGQGGAAASFA